VFPRKRDLIPVPAVAAAATTAGAEAGTAVAANDCAAENTPQVKPPYIVDCIVAAREPITNN